MCELRGTSGLRSIPRSLHHDLGDASPFIQSSPEAPRCKQMHLLTTRGGRLGGEGQGPSYRSVDNAGAIRACRWTRTPAGLRNRDS